MELFDRANEFNKAENYVEAEKCYDMLLTQNHDNAGLLATMGTMYLHQFARQGGHRLGLAISLLQRASKKMPQSDVLCNLAIAYKYSGQHAKAQEFFAKAIKQKNPSADALANYGACFVHVGTPDKAIELSKKALKIDPECSMAHWNMGLSLLELGDYEKGWDEHEWGFKSGMRIERKLGGKPQWDGTPTATVAVYGEQGIGDEIMFASMIPDLLKTNRVILECHPRLKTIFEDSFGITCYGTRDEKEPQWEDEFDYQISIGSLGKFFRRNKEAFPGTPYLKSPSAPKGEKFRVGISWTGGLKAGRIAVRAIPLSWWKTILNNDCEFISLQYTNDEADVQLMRDLGYQIKEFPEVKAHDYAETAKLVQSCDLVISVCTSVIHLAGALGVPCWVMVPNKPAWRYGVQGRMNWYKSVRLYRQPPGDGGAWMPVVERVGSDLAEMLHGVD